MFLLCIILSIIIMSIGGCAGFATYIIFQEAEPINETNSLGLVLLMSGTLVLWVCFLGLVKVFIIDTIIDIIRER